EPRPVISPAEISRIHASGKPRFRLAGSGYPRSQGRRRLPVRRVDVSQQPGLPVLEVDIQRGRRMQTHREGDSVYTEFRPLLFSIAYRMVGSAVEAEDLVQEAFLRYHREESDGAVIESPRAWLSTVTTRLALNHLESARVRRELYVGPWLPEPLVDEEPVPRRVELSDSLSLAFLVVLESLNPVERAVFLMRDVFGYGFDEIAET